MGTGQLLLPSRDYHLPLMGGWLMNIDCGGWNEQEGK